MILTFVATAVSSTLKITAQPIILLLDPIELLALLRFSNC